MIYFGYPLDIHGWKTKPQTELDWFRGPEPENRGWKTIPKPEPAEPETRGYPPQTRSAAILSRRGPENNICPAPARETQKRPAENC